MPGIQVVVLVSRKYVDVVVPDVLVARRFVVLPGRDAVAAVGFTNCNSHGLNQVENRVPDARGQSVEILEVLDRRHKYVAGVARPPLREIRAIAWSVRATRSVDALCSSNSPSAKRQNGHRYPGGS